MPPVKPNAAILNLGDPLSTSLVLAMPFLDGFGSTVADIGPNSLNGTITGGSTWVNDPTLGVVLQLDGTTGYVQLLNALNTYLNGIGAASVAIWLKLNNNVPTSQAKSGLMNLGVSGTSNANHWVEATTEPDSGSALLNVFRTGPQVTIPPAFATPLGTVDKTQWHLLVITTQSGGNWISYLNGVAMTGGTSAQSIVTATVAPTIGLSSDSSGSYFLDGLIGDFRVWSRALQPGEIGTLYNNPWGLYTPGPPQGQLKSIVESPELHVFGSFGLRSELTLGDIRFTAPYSVSGILLLGDFQPQSVSTATTAGWDPRRKPAYPPPALNGDAITTNIALALPFDEGTGTTANDQSGNSNNATLTTSGAWATSSYIDETGAASHRYNINGGAYGTITETPSLKPNVWTLAAWVYPFASGHSSGATIISKRTDGTGGSVYSYMLGISPDGTHFSVVVSDDISITPDVLNSNSGIPANQPVHIAGSYDGAFLRIYVNGVLDNNLPNTGNTLYTVGAQSVYVGPNGTGAFNGGVEDVRIWDRVLTDQEINDLYRGPFGIYCQRSLLASIVETPELSVFGSNGMRSEFAVLDAQLTGAYAASGLLLIGDFLPALQNGAGMGFFSVSPSFGTTAGGTPVVIKGYGFYNITAVYIGGTPLSGYTVVDQFTITGTTPAHLQGIVDIQINSTTNSVLTAPTVFAFTGGLGSGPRITGKLLDNTLIRQEKFTGITSTVGIDTSLSFTLADIPIDPSCVEVHVMHTGDQGMLEMLQDTVLNGGTYSVDMANSKIIWHGASAPFQLVTSDTIVVCYLAQGN